MRQSVRPTERRSGRNGGFSKVALGHHVVSLASGCESRNLHLLDVILTEGVPRIMVNADTAKNNFRGRVICLNENALAAIGRCLELAAKKGSCRPEHYLFPGRVVRGLWDPDKPASSSWLHHTWSELREATGLPWLTPHCFRHMCITGLLAKGVAPETVRQISGHVSEERMHHYSHTRHEDQKRALDTIAPKKSKPTPQAPRHFAQRPRASIKGRRFVQRSRLRLSMRAALIETQEPWLYELELSYGDRLRQVSGLGLRRSRGGRLYGTRGVGGGLHRGRGGRISRTAMVNIMALITTQISAVPDRRLREFVRIYAQRDVHLSGLSAIFEPIPARLEQTVEFQFGSPFHVHHLSGYSFKTPPQALIGAQVMGCSLIELADGVISFGVFFRPTGFSRLFRLSVRELTNRNYDAEMVSIQVQQIRERLGECATFEERVRIMDKFLLARVPHFSDKEKMIAIGEHIFSLNGVVSISAMAAAVGVGMRQFERNFLECMGVTPKLYSRVARFQSALDTKIAFPDRSWVEIAHALRYHDQMHMVHDFQKLGGDSPKRLLKCIGDARPGAMPHEKKL